MSLADYLRSIHSSNLHGLDEGPNNEELPDNFIPAGNFPDSFVPNPEYLHVTNCYGAQEFLRQVAATRLDFERAQRLGSERGFPSLTDMQGSGTSGSEAAFDRQSPIAFITDAVMSSPTYTDPRSLPTNATVSVQNSPLGSPVSTTFKTPISSHLLLNPVQNTTSSTTNRSRISLLSARDSHSQGLGIQGVAYGTSYDPTNKSVASSVPFMQDNTSYTMSEHEAADQDLFQMVDAQVQLAPVTQADFAQAAKALSNPSVVSRYRPSTWKTQAIKETIFTPTNVPSMPSLSNVDPSNYTPRTIDTPAESLAGDYSPRSVAAFSYTNYYDSASSLSLKGLKTPERPLTALQMVDKATHQPNMDLVTVALPHTTSRDQNLSVDSMDYRDTSWQGRRDDYTGWTPYVNFADFPDVLEMLRDMRSDPFEYTPDNATIFTNIQEVDEWRDSEMKKSGRNQDPQDEEEMPKTDEEKAAIVKLLFKAFKSTADGQSSDTVMTHFNAQVHSNAHVEAICWQLLEAAIRRSKGGPLCHAYEPGKPAKSAGNRDLSFAQRINALIEALRWEKSVCVNLLRAPKVLDAVDCPSYLGKRTGGNRELNKKKAEIAKLGKAKLQEMKLELEEGILRKVNDATRLLTKRGNIKRGKRSVEDFDDSDSLEASPPKRRSPENPFATPVRPFAAVNGNHDNDGYPVQVTPSSTTMTSKNSSLPSYFPSPAPSTSSLRKQMSSYGRRHASETVPPGSYSYSAAQPSSYPFV